MRRQRRAATAATVEAVKKLRSSGADCCCRQRVRGGRLKGLGEEFG